MTVPEANRPRSRAELPADRIVLVAGAASIAFGLAFVVITVVAQPGVGSFEVVPEAIAGFTSIILGVIALGLVPHGWIGSNRQAAWALLGAGIVATASVVVLAVDDLAGPIEANRQIATVVVVLGRAVAQAGMVWLIVALVLRAVWIFFSWLLTAWRSRYLR